MIFIYRESARIPFEISCLYGAREGEMLHKKSTFCANQFSFSKPTVFMKGTWTMILFSQETQVCT